MSTPDQRNSQKAKSMSPLKVIGAGFLATMAVGTTVTVVPAGQSTMLSAATADQAVVVRGDAPADALARQFSRVHDDR